MRIVEQVETAYNNLDVWASPDGYDFEVAGGTHATWRRDRLMTGYAWDAISAGVLLRDGPLPRTVLMLGLGGGTALRQIRCLLPRARITAIEIDPVMVDLARRYMELDALNLETVVGDAYTFLKDDTNTYDVVVDDVYLGGDDDVSRPAAYTDELMALLTSRLASRGAVVTNLVTGQGHRGTQRTVRACFKRSFPSVRIVKPAKGFNETLVGGWFIRGAARLQRFSSCFTNPLDVATWEQIRVQSYR